jgi:hypothetical protein
MPFWIRPRQFGISLIYTAESYGDHLSDGLIRDYRQGRDRSK